MITSRCCGCGKPIQQRHFNPASEASPSALTNSLISSLPPPCHLQQNYILFESGVKKSHLTDLAQALSRPIGQAFCRLELQNIHSASSSKANSTQCQQDSQTPTQAITRARCDIILQLPPRRHYLSITTLVSLHLLSLSRTSEVLQPSQWSTKWTLIWTLISA